MIQRTIKNRIRYSKYKLLLMLIGVLSAHSWTQAQNSPPTNEVMIDIYNPQIEMFARFKMKSSFHKTKRII